MQKHVEFLDDIISKYSTQECDLDQRLKKILLAEQQFEKSMAAKRVTFEAHENERESQGKSAANASEARQRNSDLIKELEKSKARLRSRATYTPLEQELNKAIIAYNKQRSLVPLRSGPGTTTRKVYGLTFV